MTKLSDTQRVILSMAVQHEALLATPPAKLPAAARQSVLRSLIVKGLPEEAPAPREANALRWRQDKAGAWVARRIIAAGLAAIDVEPEAAAETDSTDHPADDRPRSTCNGVDPALVIDDPAEMPDTLPSAAEIILLPAAPQVESLATRLPVPLSPAARRQRARSARL